MTGIIITVVLAAILFKVAGLIIKLCGKLIGAIFVFGGYLFIGALGIGTFGVALLLAPVLILVAIISIITAVAA